MMNYSHSYFFLFFLVTFFTSAATTVYAQNNQPISVHPDNPHYFLFRGQPTVLVTSGEHYGALLNGAFDYSMYLDELSAKGLNHTRTFSGTYRERPGEFGIAENTLAPDEAHYISPWVFSPDTGKFDLSQWNGNYFSRLHDFIQQAGSRGIVVELTLFCTFYNTQLWDVNPMNPAKNVNVNGATRDNALTLNNGNLLDFQKAFVAKIVTELNGYDNVYFEVCNEPYFGNVSRAWLDEITAHIVATENLLPNQHIISWNWANDSGSSVVDQPNTNVSLYNFHYSSGMCAKNNWSLNLPIGNNETGFDGDQDFTYRSQGWRLMMNGCALYNNLDYSFSVGSEDGTASQSAPGGGSAALRAQLGILLSFLNGLDLIHMVLDDSFIIGGYSDMWCDAMSVPVSQYAAYFSHGSVSQINLVVDIPAGMYTAEWTDTKSGTKSSSTISHAGGHVTIPSPSFTSGEDIALRIIAGPDTVAPTVSDVSAVNNNTAVTVVFSEGVTQAGAEQAGNYAINNGVSISSAVLGTDGKTVTLNVSPLSTGVTYTLTVNNVQDLASPANTIAANTQETFQYTISSFVKGINLNGGSVTVEGNLWLSQTQAEAAGFWSTNATAWSGTYAFALNPSADAGTQTMLQSVLYRGSADFSIAQSLPNGTYSVYLWMIENLQDHYRSINVDMEGVQVASGLCDLAKGDWRKYGPYIVSVNDGTLNIDLLRDGKGDPHIMGFAIYSATSNIPPTVEAGADQAITLPTNTVSLDGTVTDPDDTPATTWTKVSGPGTVTFGDASAIDTTAQFSAAGTYILQLKADDGTNPAVTDTVTIAMNPANATIWDQHGHLQVSSNGHYLEHTDGTPFLWVGDTAWGLSERLSRAEVDTYFDDRAAKGFSVVQLCLLWGKRDGVNATFTVNPANYYGHHAMKNLTPAGAAVPDVVAGGTPDSPNDYWDHVDYIVNAAQTRGIAVAILPVWGARYVNAAHIGQSQVIFTAANAKSYGEFLGSRYSANKNVIWVMGGDTDPTTNTDCRPVYRLMAEGIAYGATGQSVSWDQNAAAWNQVVLTYHPRGDGGGQSSSTWFHTDPWLDFNMIQTYPYATGAYTMVNADYNRSNPVKPTILGEGSYENTSGGALDVRRQAYHSVLAGGLGHTYGCSLGDYLWTFYGSWQSVLNSDGAQDIGLMAQFFAGREWWKWVPDQGIISSGAGSGSLIKVAVKSTDGDEILVYFPDNSSASIRMDRITSSPIVTGYWFNPADATTQALASSFATTDIPSLTPPSGWADAVLVLEAGSDTLPPTISQAAALSSTEITVVFSEGVTQASAEQAGNYAINNGVSISSAVLGTDGKTVTLNVSPLSTGVTYTLTVNNVQDLASPANTIIPGTQASFSLVDKSISVNFNAAAGTVRAAEFAGQALTGNWINTYGSSGSAYNVTDNAGIATTADVSWSAPAMHAMPGLVDDTDGNDSDRMMQGYLDIESTITVAEIPYVSYDLYLYHVSDEGDGRGMKVSLDGGITWVYTKDEVGDALDIFTEDEHVTESASQTAAGGNVIIWRGVTAYQLSIVTQSTFSGGTIDAYRSPVSGLQIIQSSGGGNVPPTVEAGADQAIALPTDTVNLDGTVTDPDDTPTTTWSKVSGPGSVTFGNSSVVDTTASFTTAGTYILQLEADDGTNPAVTDTVTITMNPAAVDSDGDGMDDSWEMSNFGDLSHDGTGDGDSDSLTDLEEYAAGTNPANPDTDGDGLLDGSDPDPLTPASAPAKSKTTSGCSASANIPNGSALPLGVLFLVIAGFYRRRASRIL